MFKGFSFLFFAVGGCVLLACSGPHTEQAVTVPDPVAAIQLHMAEQQQAWNDGDLPAFMRAYHRNDSLVFIGKSGLTYGWEPTLANYRRGYPDKTAMGRLEFNNLDYRVIADDACFVIGKWTLYRDLDTLSGHYSLIWQYLGGEWRITADHSS